MILYHKVEYLKGKTWQLGTVKQNSTEVSADFTGFQISFNADGSAGQITTGGSASETVAVNYTYSDNSITISPLPDGWTGTLSNVVATESSFNFSIIIESAKTGSLTYVFDLIPL